MAAFEMAVEGRLSRDDEERADPIPGHPGDR